MMLWESQDFEEPRDCMTKSPHYGYIKAIQNIQRKKWFHFYNKSCVSRLPLTVSWTLVLTFSNDITRRQWEATLVWPDYRRPGVSMGALINQSASLRVLQWHVGTKGCSTIQGQRMLKEESIFTYVMPVIHFITTPKAIPHHCRSDSSRGNWFQSVTQFGCAYNNKWGRTPPPTHRPPLFPPQPRPTSIPCLYTEVPSVGPALSSHSARSVFTGLFWSRGKAHPHPLFIGC